MPERPYTYYDFTLSLCPQCLRRIEAKIVFEDGNVFSSSAAPSTGGRRCASPPILSTTKASATT